MSSDNMTDMTSRERLLAVINGENGEKADRVPWSPFLAYFWEARPKELEKVGQLEFLKGEGFDPLFRGSHVVYSISYPHCKIYQQSKGNETYTFYETPVGTLVSTHTYKAESNTSFLSGHPVKTPGDFKILQYLNEDAVVTDNSAHYERDKTALGEDGLYLPLIGSQCKTCFQSMVEHWVGTEELVYALADYPDIVEECLLTMRTVSEKTAHICAQTSGEAFIFWEDSSTTNISPAMFQKYTVPEIKMWADILHIADKKLVHHACGHIKALISHMVAAGIDLIDSVPSPPTGDISVADTWKALPENVGIIGGIEPVAFLCMSMDELEVYVKDILTVSKGRRLILANSDSCPPGVTVEKMRMVRDLVRTFAL